MEMGVGRNALVARRIQILVEVSRKDQVYHTPAVEASNRYEFGRGRITCLSRFRLQVLRLGEETPTIREEKKGTEAEYTLRYELMIIQKRVNT